MDYMAVSKVQAKTEDVGAQDYMAVSKVPTKINQLESAKEKTSFAVGKNVTQKPGETVISKAPMTINRADKAISKVPAPTNRLQTAIGKDPTTVNQNEVANTTLPNIGPQDYMAVSKVPKKSKEQTIGIQDYMAQTKLASAKPIGVQDYIAQTKQMKQSKIARKEETSTKSTVTTTTTSKTKIVSPEIKNDKTKKDKMVKENVKEVDEMKAPKSPVVQSKKDAKTKKITKIPNFAARRKSLICKLIVILVVIIVLAAAITGMAMYMVYTFNTTTAMPTTITTRKPELKIQNITEVCNRNTDLKDCWYYEKKFVDSCKEVKCRFVGLTPYFVVENGWRRLTFRQESSYKNISVPDGTPCDRIETSDVGDIGYCDNGVCQPRLGWPDLDEFYANRTEVNGDWSTTDVPHKLACINHTEINRSKNTSKPFSWIKFVNIGSCENDKKNRRKQKSIDCINIGYKIRNCNNPLPALGGKPCWNDETKIEWYEWPLKLNKLCDTCVEPEDKPEDLKCFSTTKNKHCNLVHGFEEDVDNMYIDNNTSFEFCCNTGKLKTEEGRCIMGQCVATGDA